MKTKILALSIILSLGLIFQGCEKEDLGEPSSNNTANQTKTKTLSSKSTEGFTYYSQGSNEFSSVVNDILVVNDGNDTLLISELNTANQLIKYLFTDGTTVNVLEISSGVTNKYVVTSPSIPGDYFHLHTNEDDSLTHYDYLNKERTLFGGISSRLNTNPGQDVFLSPRAQLILQCVQDHFDDICGTNFWTAATCTLGCYACPECCLGAAVIFGIGCANELSLSE